MQAGNAALTRGDRVPNFLLPGLDDKLWVFYDKVRGKRNLLVLHPAGEGTAVEVIEGIEAALPALGKADIDPFLVLVGAEATIRADISKLSKQPSFMVFQDLEGKVYPALARAFGRGPEQALALLLDENQRVLEDLGAPDAQVPAMALASSEKQPRLGRTGTLDSVAPVLIVPNVLDDATCDALIDRWHKLGHVEGLAQSRDAQGRAKVLVAHETKKRRDHRITDAAVARDLSQLIGRRIAPELSKSFGLEGFAFDHFVVTCYAAERGDYFRPHRDNTTKETQDRLFAMTLNLNTDDYEGGGLHFPEYGPTHYAPPRGGAILFPCSLIHEATPVTKGHRFTLLSFLRRPQRSANLSPIGIWGAGRPQSTPG